MRRLKYILLGLIVISMGSNAQAQDDDKKKGSSGDSKIGGVRAGYNASRLYNGDTYLYETDPLGSFYLGIYKNFRIVPVLKWGVGLEYLWKETIILLSMMLFFIGLSIKKYKIRLQ